MNFNLKNNKKAEPYLEQLKHFCENIGIKMEYKYYSNFITIYIVEDFNVSALVREEHYLNNDYILDVYDFLKRTADVKIPMNLIDTIYGI